MNVFKILGRLWGIRKVPGFTAPEITGECQHQHVDTKRKQSSGDQTQYVSSWISPTSFSYLPEDILCGEERQQKQAYQTARKTNRHHSPTCHLKEAGLQQETDQLQHENSRKSVPLPAQNGTGHLTWDLLNNSSESNIRKTRGSSKGCPKARWKRAIKNAQQQLSFLKELAFERHMR